LIGLWMFHHRLHSKLVQLYWVVQFYCARRKQRSTASNWQT